MDFNTQIKVLKILRNREQSGNLDKSLNYTGSLSNKWWDFLVKEGLVSRVYLSSSYQGIRFIPSVLGHVVLIDHERRRDIFFNRRKH